MTLASNIFSGSAWVCLTTVALDTCSISSRDAPPHTQFRLELAVGSLEWLPQDAFIHNPRIMAFLINAQEWDKLERWMEFIWIVWPPGSGGMTEEDLERSMLSLFRQRPGAAQKLEWWMERRSQKLEQWKNHYIQERARDISESFRRFCRRAHEAAQRDAP